MKLEAGKSYRTRNGNKVTVNSCDDNEGATFNSKDFGLYRADGTFGYGSLYCEGFDIIAEWIDGPAASEYNDGKWHGWNGGQCQVHPKSRIEASDGHGVTSDYAGMFDWGGGADHIIAFRVIKAYTEPREWWLDPITVRAYADKRHGCIHVREVIDEMGVGNDIP